MAVNLLLDHAIGDRLLVTGDDSVFVTAGWNEKLDFDGLICPSDGREKDSSGNYIVNREYAEALGYVVPPFFVHWQADTYMLDLFREIGKFRFEPEVTILHLKPHEVNEVDDTWNWIRRPGMKERDQLVRKRWIQRYFDHDKALLNNIGSSTARESLPDSHVSASRKTFAAS